MRAPRVLVVGGGPAGAAAALTLAEAGVPALVVDRATALVNKPGECLTSAFRPLLERLGLLELLARHRRIPAFQSRWDLDQTHTRELIASPHGEGWLLERRRFEAQLIATACERGAVWQLGWSIAGLERREHAWVVELRRGSERRSVGADFVLDASGRAARLLRLLGEPRRPLDRLFGSWLVTPTRGRGDGPVLIEADADGWWYAAALPDGRCSLVWFSDRGETDARALLERARERTLIATRVPVAHDGSPKVSVHPAGSARAARVCGPGWFAVGDAAQAFDPLSSHGIGSALGTGFHAARALLDGWGVDAARAQELRAAYQALLDDRWSAYSAELTQRYAVVHSWSDRRFWRERRRCVASWSSSLSYGP